MKKLINPVLTALLLNLLACISMVNIVSAQCSTSAAPTYSNACTNEYVTSISATGTGVVSTISVTGGTCGTTQYFDSFATEGVTVSAGNAVNINFSKHTTTYTGLLWVYVDWNNDGTYDPITELAGTMMTLPSGMPSAVYSFIVPTTGIVTGTNLHMRIFLSETTGTTSAPCAGSYGQTYDFYLYATCPPATITFSPPTDTICSGGSGILTASGIGAGDSYTWSAATGLSAATGATVTAAPGITTVYTVTGVSAIGCTYADTIKVTVIPGGGPVDTIITSDTTRFCFGDSAWLHGSIGAGYTYQWYNGTIAVTGATDSIYKATTSGSYTLKITIPSGCSSMSSPIVITAFNPIPVITFDGKTLRTGKFYATYQWYDSTSAITGATHDSLIIHSNGHYTVKVTDTNGCKGVSTIYAATLAVPNIANNGTAISIYPNPANSIIHIESLQIVNAVITSIEGKTITKQNDVHTMDISNLPTGVYLIELFDETGHRLTVQKLIKN